MASRFLPAILTERLREAASRLPGDPVQALALRAIGRAERVFEQLESTAKVLDKVAHAQLKVLEKLDPIVDDLGRLVRLQLEDARRRLGGSRTEAPEPEVIEGTFEPKE